MSSSLFTHNTMVGCFGLHDVVTETPQFFTIYASTEWIKFGGVKYNITFGKGKKKLILKKGGITSDEKERSEDVGSDSLRILKVRINELQTLEQELCTLILKSTELDLSEMEEKEINNDIKIWKGLIKSSKKYLIEYRTNNYVMNFKYKTTKKTDKIVLAHGKKYKVDDFIITWFHYTGNIVHDCLKTTNEVTEYEGKVKINISNYYQDKINNIR